MYLKAGGTRHWLHGVEEPEARGWGSSRGSRGATTSYHRGFGLLGRILLGLGYQGDGGVGGGGGDGVGGGGLPGCPFGQMDGVQ